MEIKDFTKQRDPIRFRIDADVFEAAPAIPAQMLGEFAGRFRDLRDGSDQLRFDALVEVLGMILLPDSFERFRVRLLDRNEPIDIDQVNDAIVWLLEIYGLRPTKPSLPSPDGQPSPASGTSSTVDAPPEVSTLLPSPQTVS